MMRGGAGEGRRPMQTVRPRATWRWRPAPRAVAVINLLGRAAYGGGV